MPRLKDFLSQLDSQSSQPLYLKLQRALRDAIEQGALGPDDALPSERQLANDLGISRITVRKAIDGLVEDGLLVRRQDSGNFVGTRIEKYFAKLTSFSEDMRSRGRVPSSQWLRRQVGQVTPEESIRLGLSPGARVYRFTRLRFADDVEKSLHLLAAQPGMGSHRHAALLRWPAIRSWPLRPWPYLVLYQPQGDHLDIVRVLHTARDIAATLAEPDTGGPK